MRGQVIELPNSQVVVGRLRQQGTRRVVVGRLRQGSHNLRRVYGGDDGSGAIDIEHHVDVGPETARKIDELRDAALTLRTGVIIVGIVGAIALAGLLIYLASRPAAPAA